MVGALLRIAVKPARTSALVCATVCSTIGVPAIAFADPDQRLPALAKHKDSLRLCFLGRLSAAQRQTKLNGLIGRYCRQQDGHTTQLKGETGEGAKDAPPGSSDKGKCRATWLSLVNEQRKCLRSQRMTVIEGTKAQQGLLAHCTNLEHDLFYLGPSPTASRGVNVLPPRLGRAGHAVAAQLSFQ
jgi:hypothetical protein